MHVSLQEAILPGICLTLLSALGRGAGSHVRQESGQEGSGQPGKPEVRPGRRRATRRPATHESGQET